MGARISAFFEAACRPTVNYTFGRYYCYQFLVNPYRNPRRPIPRTRSDQSRTVACNALISFFFYASRFCQTRILFSSRDIKIPRFALFIAPHFKISSPIPFFFFFFFEDRTKKLGEKVKIRRRL